MCGGIIVGFAPVHTPPQLAAVRAENHSSDGNVPGGGLRGDIQGATHQRFRARIPGNLRQPAVHPHRLELQLHAHQVRQLVGEAQLVRHAQNLFRPVQLIVVEDDGHYLLARTQVLQQVEVALGPRVI